VPRADIEAQIAALQQQLEAEGDDTELWVRDEKGRETKLTGALAKRWLKTLGLEDEPDPAGDGGDGDPAGGQTDPPPAGGKSVWGRK
jgi:hypothetical protein